MSYSIPQPDSLIGQDEIIEATALTPSGVEVRPKVRDDWPMQPRQRGRALDRIRQASLKVFEMEWKDLPPPRRTRRTSRPTPVLDQWIQDRLVAGHIEEVEERFVHCVVPHFDVPKPHDPESRRVVGDFRWLNGFVKPMECEYPRVVNIWLSVFQAEEVSTCDVLDGFYQVHIPVMYRRFFGINLRGRMFRYKRLPQGFINAPAIFTRFMAMLLPPHPRLMFYMDDVVGLDMTPEALTSIMRDAELPLNHRKTRSTKDGFCSILGMEVHHSSHLVSIRIPDKASYKLTLLQQPKTPRQAFQYAGLVQFYAPFLPEAFLHLQPYYASKVGRDWDSPLPFTISPSVPLISWPAQRSWFRSPLTLDFDASQEGCGAVVHAEGVPIMTFFTPRTTAKWKKTVGVYREAIALKWIQARLPDLPVQRIRSDSQPLVLSSLKQEQAFQAWSKHVNLRPLKLSFVNGEENLADFASRPFYHLSPRVMWSKAIARLRRAGRKNAYRMKVRAPPPLPPFFAEIVQRIKAEAGVRG